MPACLQTTGDDDCRKESFPLMQEGAPLPMPSTGLSKEGKHLITSAAASSRPVHGTLSGKAMQGKQISGAAT